MYARGILFGKMKYELGDHSFVRCPESGLAADLEFKNKGYFSGKDDAIGGFIKNTKTDKNLFELSGSWIGKMFIKDLAVGGYPHLQFYSSCRLTGCRVESSSFYSMLPKRARRTPQHDRFRSKRIANRKDCGVRSSLR